MVGMTGREHMFPGAPHAGSGQGRRHEWQDRSHRLSCHYVQYVRIRTHGKKDPIHLLGMGMTGVASARRPRDSA